jgi:hypothetical protein
LLSEGYASAAGPLGLWRLALLRVVRHGKETVFCDVCVVFRSSFKLRDIVPKCHTMKTNAAGLDRPFGGINVLLVGDFWQLDPPGGGFLGDIPVDFIHRARKYSPKPDVAHGQSILWGQGPGSVQGVTELTECIRTEDDWLLEVQEEMRAGNLSENNWHFLHGRPTTVPGSWTRGSCKCRNRTCAQLVGCPDILTLECNVCREDRRSRHRVLNTEHDERYRQTEDPDFTRAPAIFPNNDIKYEVNKLRAEIFSAASNQALTWCPAKDKPNTRVLNEKPNITEEKVTWLQRHDRDCGDLYGMLPLAVGMPVALTDHVDRNPEKNLLRGRVGYIDSWVLADEESSCFEDGTRILQHMVKAVLVQFKEWVENEKGELVYNPCKWTIAGIDRPGVYPIAPWKRSWHLDQRRIKPVLEVKRLQVPLAPAYAVTAHGAQGQTLPACIVDLELGRGVNNIASYVAMTRVRKREHLLIYRDFSLEPFCQGGPEGPTLLLKTLKREYVDWKAVEEKHIPQRKCRGFCMCMRLKDEFSALEWRNQEDPHCKACVQKRQNQGTPYRCTRCRNWFTENSFAESMMYNKVAQRLCQNCVANSQQKPRKCSHCGIEKAKEQFTPALWNKCKKDRKCIDCMAGRKCCECDTQGDQHMFARCEWDKPHDQRKCLECMTKRCSRCRTDKRRPMYAMDQWKLLDGDVTDRFCYDCNRKQCSKCFVSKGQKDFDNNLWSLPNKHPDRLCFNCVVGPKQVGMWLCQNQNCRKRKPVAEFSIAIRRRGGKPENVKSNSKRCNACIAKFDHELRDMAAASAAQVQKRKRTN